VEVQILGVAFLKITILDINKYDGHSDNKKSHPKE
jgi:hypothetical protein